MAGEEGFEPTTYGFGDRHSNQLSYSPSASCFIATDSGETSPDLRRSAAFHPAALQCPGLCASCGCMLKEGAFMTRLSCTGLARGIMARLVSPRVLLGLALMAASLVPHRAMALEECKCEDLGAIQTELAIALLLKQRFENQARTLIEKYGQNPKGSDYEQAFRDYNAFQDGKGEGSAAHGLREGKPGEPDRVPYVPRGARERLAYEDNPRSGKGIPAGRKWVNDISVVDLDERRTIETRWKKAGKDLCAPDDPAKMEQSLRAGAKCAGIARAFAVHEASHADTCRQMGFYAFWERPAHQLAADEARAYTAQAEALGAEIQRVMGQKRTKVRRGPSGACPECYLEVQATCIKSYEVSGKVQAIELTGRICDIERAFTLRSVGMSKVNFQMTPWDGGTRGAYTYQGTGGGARFVGDGRYTIAIGENEGKITLFSDGEAHVVGKKVKDTGMGTFKLTPLQDACE